MRITGTFIDEISHDIPHQNWGEMEWDADFAAMKAIGIDTVIMIRCGYKRWQTFPSTTLTRKRQCYKPPVDLLALFLQKAEKYGLDFWFGLYDSGEFWETEQYDKEVDINLALIEEVWHKYGQQSQAFKGWYLSQEVSRRTGGMIETYSRMGRYAKEVSGGLPVLISPYIDGVKAVNQ